MVNVSIGTRNLVDGRISIRRSALGPNKTKALAFIKNQCFPKLIINKITGPVSTFKRITVTGYSYASSFVFAKA